MDIDIVKRFIYGAKEAYKEVDDHSYNFPITIESAYRLAINIETLLKEQEKEIKALRLLVEWATDCDFSFDQFPDEYEQYKDEVKDMEYIDGMIHVAKRTLEDHEAFEESW